MGDWRKEEEEEEEEEDDEEEVKEGSGFGDFDFPDFESTKETVKADDLLADEGRLCGGDPPPKETVRVNLVSFGKSFVLVFGRCRKDILVSKNIFWT